VIARIEGQDTKGWTTEKAVEHLRGQKGTTVNIGLRRLGYDALIPLQVQRDEVRMPTVPAAVMLDATTGYVRVSDFGENTDQELGRALRDLTQKGMKRLVFDLRENPGGALDQAIKVSNRFIQKGKLIVYTRGRVPNSDQDYHATESTDYINIPMVTLVNRNSASASEIVSGASEGASPRRRHREDRRRRREGVDERAGGRPSARTQAVIRQHLDSPRGL